MAKDNPKPVFSANETWLQLVLSIADYDLFEDSNCEMLSLRPMEDLGIAV